MPVINYSHYLVAKILGHFSLNFLAAFIIGMFTFPIFNVIITIHETISLAAWLAIAQAVNREIIERVWGRSHSLTPPF